ncbi:MAG: hypothetical protein ACXACU_13070 [Candidatus Hodarchaeales archaeon]|jgi:hypothetical protein
MTALLATPSSFSLGVSDVILSISILSFYFVIMSQTLLIQTENEQLQASEGEIISTTGLDIFIIK